MSIRRFFGFLPPRLLYSKDIERCEEFPLSERFILLMKKGSEGVEPDISVGDSVKSGQRISSVDGESWVFSSVSGVVEEISDLSWIDGKEFKSFTVKRSGAEEWESIFDGLDDPLRKTGEELLALLSAAGFDLGISSPDGCDTVIVSCLESDIFVSNNRSILTDNKENISAGIKLIKHITGADDIILAVSNKDDLLLEGIPKEGVTVRAVSPTYPNGMEEILPGLLLKGKERKSSIVINLEILNAMVVTLKSGRPFVDKVITLIESGGRLLKNIKVRVGTPVSEILSANNIELEERARIALGGPMRGSAIYDIDFPVTLDTDAILVQGRGEASIPGYSACINCDRCVRVCPSRLQANLLSRYSEFSLFENCEELDIDCCIECGLCSYVCMARRPNLQFMQFAKREIERLKEEERDEDE